jgi:protein O-mannosyl-transferase
LLLLDYWPLGRFGKSNSARAIQTEVINPASSRQRKGKTGKHTPRIIVESEKPATHEFQWAMVRPLILEKIPLFALTILSCAATYIAQNRGGAIVPIEIYTLDIRVANALVSYFIYITKTILPDNLAVYYPHPGMWPVWQVLGAVLFLGVVTFAVIRMAQRFPYLPVGWLWFTGTLVPVIGIVQVGGQALADRYTYIPSIGLFIMAAWGIPKIFRKRRYAIEAVTAFAVLCLLMLFILTSRQVGYWRDSVTLFDHALSVTKNNGPMLNNRGNALHSMGNHTRAIEDFNRAVEINPLFAAAFNGRGLARKSMGNYMGAIEDFDRAVAIDPSYAGAYNSRGLVHNNMGNYSRAIEDFDRAIQIDSKLAPAYNNRGNARDFLGDHVRAIEDFDRAIEIDSEYADAYNNRGIAYDSMGNRLRAIEDFNRAIAINPGYAIAYYNRGSVHASLGNEKQAFEDMKAAAKSGSEDAKNFLRSKEINW